MKKLAPWWLKILLKIIIAKLRINYELLKRIGLLQHGQMHDPAQALQTFNHHWQRLKREPGFVFLELGPGNSVASGIIAKAYGAKRSYLVDAGKFASEDMKEYEKIISFLIDKKILSVETKKEFKNMQEILDYFEIVYLTEGTSSLAKIIDKNIDIVFSHVVLEHVVLSEIDLFLQELKRISANGSIQSHCIDLRDHLDNSLNNMRFSSKVWESDTFVKSGFYTNRINYSKFLTLFQDAGFRVKVVSKNKWDKLPIKKELLSKEFQNLSTNDLMINEFEVILE